MFSKLFGKIIKKGWFAGLDISSSSIKLLVMSQSHQQYCVEAFDVEPLVEGATAEKEIKEPHLVAESIRKLIQRCPLKVTQVAVAVADASVITKIVPFDKSLSESEIEAQILLEAERYIPYPIEEVRFDFEILGDSQEPHYVDVLLAASRSETVDNYIIAVTQAGLQLKVVDVESYALLRACDIVINQLIQKNEHITAIFDIGANRSILTVVKNGKLIFTREDSFGGRRLIELISQTMSISNADAEKVMKQSNWTKNLDATVLQYYINDIVENIRRELQFFSSATQYDEVDLILLAGGTALLPGLAEQVSDILNVPTSIANPFSSMTFSQHVDADLLLKKAPGFMQTCGLALRSFHS